MTSIRANNGQRPLPIEKNNSSTGINRWEGLAVPGIVVLMLISAYLVFKLGLAPSHTVNKGELVNPPFSVKELDLRSRTDGKGIDWSNKKWRIFLPVSNQCNQACLSNLYETRQVHKLLAGKAERVERYLLMTTSDINDDFTKVLDDEYPRLKRVPVDYAEFKALLNSSSVQSDPAAENKFYIVDQEGFLMMEYSEENTGKELLADIKRLLRYSYEK